MELEYKIFAGYVKGRAKTTLWEIFFAMDKNFALFHIFFTFFPFFPLFSQKSMEKK